MKKKILFSMLTIFLVIGVLEISLRLIMHPRTLSILRGFRTLTEDNPAIIEDNYLLWKLKPDIDIRQRNITIDTDGSGFRGSSLKDNKPNRTYKRITVIGDSSAFGWGVKRHKTYAFRLQEIINESGHAYEVFNCGVPGYSSLQCLHLVRSNQAIRDSDILIVHCGNNDSTIRGNIAADKDVILPPLPGFMDNIIFRNSQLVKGFSCVRLYLKTKKSSGENILRVSLDDYHKNLDQIKNIIETNGGLIYFITPLWYIKKKIEKNAVMIEEKDPRGKRVRFIKDEGQPSSTHPFLHQPAVDIYTIFKNNEDKARVLILDFCHPTPSGHKVIAQAIFETIKKDL